MTEKGYTILVLSDAPSRARQWHLTERGLRVALVGGCLAILAVAFLVIYSLTIQLDVADFERLRETVEAQRTVATRLDTLTQEMTRLRTFDHQIRRLAGMEELQSGGGAMGGGTIELQKGLAAGEKVEYERLIERLYEDLQRLEREVALRTESLEAVTSYLNQQKDRLAATPSIWPLESQGYISSPFGPRTSPFNGRRQMHTGVDIASPQGTPILAAAEGIVTFSGRMAGYGQVVVVTHGFDFKTFYGHNHQNKVRKGQHVKRGQVVGTVGNSGYSTGSHLHYEVLVKDAPVDPLKYIVDEELRTRMVRTP